MFYNKEDDEKTFFYSQIGVLENKSFQNFINNISNNSFNNVNNSDSSSGGENIKNSLKISGKNIILLADDNQLILDSNRNIIKKCLEELDLEFDIILCNDGVDVVKHILDTNINKYIKIIITDENMEVLNGSETINLVRKLESRNFLTKLYCISVTCQEDRNFVNNILSAGANYIVHKPLSKSAIKNILFSLKL